MISDGTRRPETFDHVSEGDTRENALSNNEEDIKLYLDPVEDDLDSPDAEVVEIAV